MIYEHTNYRGYLKSIFADRAAKNPSYSLRAYAKQIGIDQSLLVKVLAGKKNLSFESAMDVAQKLQLKKTEAEYFGLLVQFEGTTKMNLKTYYMDRLSALAPQRQSFDLSVDAFKAISEWYHIAILSLVHLDNFEATPQNIAAQLGITKTEAEVALERLMRLELLEETAPNRLKSTHNRVLVTANVPNTALRKYHQELLEMAITSLEEQSPQERVNGSLTVPFAPELLTEAQTIVNEFKAKMSELAKRSKKPSAVYHLAINFFKLTKNTKPTVKK